MASDTMSVASSTSTRGAQTLDWLCNEIQREGGERKYVCDPGCMVDLRKVSPNDPENHKKAILHLINQLFSYVETQTNRSVELFYIGKTYVHKAKNRREFDPMNPDTWKKEGIISRWGRHSDSLHGRDGLVVLTVVTREVKPSTFSHQEEYALRLEEELAHYCRNDSRLANSTLAPGKKDHGKSIGYPLYVTFCLGQKRYSLRPLPLDCLLQGADIEIQNSIEAEIISEINLPPQSEFPTFQEIEGITLDAEIEINVRVPVKVTALRQTNRPFSLPVQKIDLLLNPQATTKLKYYN